MKISDKSMIKSMMFACLLLITVIGDGETIEPTLARLSFWVPPERIVAFEAAYREKMVPVLKRHGMVESSERGRPTAEGFFTRLFEFEDAVAGWETWDKLGQDSVWKELI
jgi:hypothetical protein